MIVPPRDTAVTGVWKVGQSQAGTFAKPRPPSGPPPRLNGKGQSDFERDLEEQIAVLKRQLEESEGVAAAKAAAAAGAPSSSTHSTFATSSHAATAPQRGSTTAMVTPMSALSKQNACATPQTGLSQRRVPAAEVVPGKAQPLLQELPQQLPPQMKFGTASPNQPTAPSLMLPGGRPVAPKRRPAPEALATPTLAALAKAPRLFKEPGQNGEDENKELQRQLDEKRLQQLELLQKQEELRLEQLKLQEQIRRKQQEQAVKRQQEHQVPFMIEQQNLQHEHKAELQNRLNQLRDQELQEQEQRAATAARSQVQAGRIAPPQTVPPPPRGPPPSVFQASPWATVMPANQEQPPPPQTPPPFWVEAQPLAPELGAQIRGPTPAAVTVQPRESPLQLRVPTPAAVTVQPREARSRSSRRIVETDEVREGRGAAWDKLEGGSIKDSQGASDKGRCDGGSRGGKAIGVIGAAPSVSGPIKPVKPRQPKLASETPCRFWLKGACTRGTGCRFLHDIEVESSNAAMLRSGNTTGVVVGCRRGLGGVPATGSNIGHTRPLEHGQALEVETDMGKEEVEIEIDDSGADMSFGSHNNAHIGESGKVKLANEEFELGGCIRLLGGSSVNGEDWEQQPGGGDGDLFDEVEALEMEE
eukprot:TRINITY_DN25301_c0_g2_i1.p1 TRINITY_DN25301_c0_g2~~TRINITY_DN25301_c0_g2_i1.p1  ORF type:complete len:643 (+),score=137.86 TRINITY_DN25301_c0_g2_i1:83-2011(+)